MTSSNLLTANTPAANDHIRLHDVGMSYGKRPVFTGFCCRFPRGKISVILGGSGSGKSTILRLIGGLLRPQRGQVIVDGDNVAAMSEHDLTTVRRKLGMLFQGGAMLDSYTVFANLALPLRETTLMGPGEIADAVHGALRSVGVEDADDLLPGQLSGGMLRRVALARAIIRKPVILLCDEPFSGLDPLSIKRIEKLLAEINRQFGITLVVVSHDIPSTMRMADHLVLLLENRVCEGIPADMRRGSDPEVAEFLNAGLDLTHGDLDHG